MRTRNLIQLHGIVLLSSLIPLIALKITIPSVEIVLVRCFIAVLIIGTLIFVGRYDYKVTPQYTVRLLLTGLLTSIYWTLLFLSAKTANASVSLVGVASTSIWTGFILAFVRRQPVNKYQIFLGLTALFGIWIIKHTGFQHSLGLTIGLIAGFFGALLTVLNAELGKKFHYYVITFYQMIGAFLGVTLFVPFYLQFYSSSHTLQLDLTSTDWILICVLALLFSIFLYAQLIRLMRTISPFTVTLTANLSPIYGMFMALLILGKSEVMSWNFYLGSAIIVSALLIYPILQRKDLIKEDEPAHEETTVLP